MKARLEIGPYTVEVHGLDAAHRMLAELVGKPEPHPSIEPAFQPRCRSVLRKLRTRKTPEDREATSRRLDEIAAKHSERRPDLAEHAAPPPVVEPPEAPPSAPPSEPEVEDEPAPETERSQREPVAPPAPAKGSHADQVLEAFRADPSYPLPLLAEQVYGTPGTRSEMKLRLLIERLTTSGQLEREGERTWFVAGAKRPKPAKPPGRRGRPPKLVTAPVDDDAPDSDAGDDQERDAPDDFEDPSELDLGD